MKPSPSSFQKSTLWAAITALSVTVLGSLFVGLIYLSTSVIAFLQPLLIPFAIAGVIAYLLEPVVAKLVKWGLSRFVAVWLVFLVVMSSIVGLSFIVVPAFAKQSAEFARVIPAYSVKAKEQILQFANDWNGRLLGTFGIDLLHWELPVEGSPSKKEEELQIKPEPSDPAVPAASDSPEAGTPVTELNLNATGSTDPLSTLGADDANLLIASPVEDGEIQTRVSNEDVLQVYTLQDLLNGDWLKQMLPKVGERLWEFIRSSVGGFLGVSGFLLSMIIVPLYLYYFLMESRHISETWMNYLPLRASRFKDEVVSTLTEINQYLIAFFRGQLVVSLINGVATGLGLSLVGLKFGWLIGLALCVLGIIPYLGIIVTWIPAVIIASVQGGSYLVPESSPWWVYPLVVTGIFAFVQQIDGLFVTPKIVGESVGLHPMTVIVSVFAWSLVLGGLLGAILAVPLTAALKVLFTRYVWNRARAQDLGPVLKRRVSSDPPVDSAP